MFLTLEDPNAKIKGSRDPLGVQPLWASFARRLITNLTTQSSSVRGFTILLLGRYLAARLIEEGAIVREEALNVFLRVEQVGAYARHVAHGVEGDIRGIERVKGFLEEGRGRVPIAADRNGMILSDQKMYGLWGLFSVPARVSGLIPDGPLGVEPKAAEFIEQNYLPLLNPALPKITRLLRKGGKLDTRQRDPVFQAFADVLREEFTPQEVEFYGRYIRDGLEVETDARGRQARLREILENHGSLDAPAGRVELLELSKRARSTDPELARRLERIVSLEAVLAPADALFQHLLTQTAQRPTDIAEAVRKWWGSAVPSIDSNTFRELLPEVQKATNTDIASAIERFGKAASTGDYEIALRAVLDWNARVMVARKAGPWAVVGEDGLVDVRYRGAEQLLPEREKLPTLWRNDYFFGSLKRVSRQLRRGA